MAFFLARAAGETGPWYKSRLFWGGVAACGVLMVVNDHLDAKIAARGPPSDRVLEEANEWESDAEALREIRERNPHLKRVLTEEPPVWADTKLLNKKEAEPGSANASAAAAAAASATATTTDQGE